MHYTPIMSKYNLKNNNLSYPLYTSPKEPLPMIIF